MVQFLKVPVNSNEFWKSNYSGYELPVFIFKILLIATDWNF